MSARFDLVRTDAGWFARFIAKNGREVWRTSETYTRRRAAERAIELVTGWPVVERDGWCEVTVSFAVDDETGLLEVRLLDERGQA